MPGTLTVIEMCAGGGGQAIGLEDAGFDLRAAIEIDDNACATLRWNRPHWDVRQADLKTFTDPSLAGIDLLAGGVPCPPFSIAGKQLGSDDERDLFPAALRLVRLLRPRAIMLENVRGLATEAFASYREGVQRKLRSLGYDSEYRVLNASDFGVPQLRPRFVLVAFEGDLLKDFEWPEGSPTTKTVGSTLFELMASGGWQGAAAWAERASSIAPTLVGGSKKHGGADLGPTRAREKWAALGVDGRGLADSIPSEDFPIDGMPRLTLEMVTRLQGFPPDWKVTGRKTAAYRQVGNAFPPPVARAVGLEIKRALSRSDDRAKSVAALTAAR